MFPFFLLLYIQIYFCLYCLVNILLSMSFILFANNNTTTGYLTDIFSSYFSINLISIFHISSEPLLLPPSIKTALFCFPISPVKLLVLQLYLIVWVMTNHQVKQLRTFWRCPHGVMVKVMDGGIVVSEFELQLRYYIHLQTITLGKSMNLLIPPAMGWILFF